MCAGAFAMATGEYVSVRSQRELFEYQIGLERDELAQYPGGRGAGACAHLRGEGLASARKRRSSPHSIVADPEHALDTLAREELGLNPDELGSPWGAAIASFLSFAAGALAAARAVHGDVRAARAAGRDRRHRARAVRRRRAAVAVHRTRRAPLRLADARARRRSRAPSRSPWAASRVSRLADAASRVLRLKPGREKSLRQRHPWIFSGAIAARRRAR